MPYVSARYAPPDATGFMPEPEENKRRIIATDDQGVEWFLTENSQVGDWLRFIEQGGTVFAAEGEPTMTGTEKDKTDKDNKNDPSMYQDTMRNIAAGGTGANPPPKPAPKPQPKAKPKKR